MAVESGSSKKHAAHAAATPAQARESPGFDNRPFFSCASRVAHTKKGQEVFGELIQEARQVQAAAAAAAASGRAVRDNGLAGRGLRDASRKVGTTGRGRFSGPRKKCLNCLGHGGRRNSHSVWRNRSDGRAGPADGKQRKGKNRWSRLTRHRGERSPGKGSTK